MTNQCFTRRVLKINVLKINNVCNMQQESGLTKTYAMVFVCCQIKINLELRKK